VRALRVLTIALAALAVVAPPAAAAYSFGTYRGQTNTGHQVEFDLPTFDPGDLHRFTRDFHVLFLGLPIVHSSTAPLWSFHGHNAHWRVKGHWIGSTEVHGTICDLVQSPSGCPDGEHLQTYVAHVKGPK
jgi:hypothetical protein